MGVVSSSIKVVDIDTSSQDALETSSGDNVQQITLESEHIDAIVIESVEENVETIDVV